MIYRFENFELDEGCAELRRGGAVIPTEPQVFALLHLLVSAHDRVVTRDEIFEKIWGNRIVSDAALSSRIRDVRKVVGDDGAAQRLIKTVQRRGLRFVGQLDTGAPASPATPAPAPVQPTRATPQNGDALDRPAVAVMPFENLSEDTEDGFLAAGLTDELVAALSAWRYFPVVSRNMMMQYGADTPAAPLSARYVVSGTFRRQGTRVKVSVSLDDTEQGQQLWSQRITRAAEDLIDLEEEIAAQIATMVAPELEGAEARRVLRRPAADLSAWELAMRASWLIAQGAEADFAKAEFLAAQAIERAPDWPLPYTLIALAKFQQAMLGFSGANTRDAFSETLAAAKTALDIDRGAWIAHALTAVGELWTNLNHERAQLHVKRAIELNPSAAMNYHFGGCIFGFSGEPEAARGYQERLFRLDPLYPYTAVIEADLGLWHMLDEEFPEADNRLHRAHKWDPRYGRALQRQIALAGLKGERDAAQVAARKLSDLGLTLNYAAIADSYPFRNPDHGEMFLDGLRRSGVNF